MDKRKAILFAFLAAVFYAVNVPVSKVLLQEAGPATMAALLYLGAGKGYHVEGNRQCDVFYPNLDL